MPLKPRFLHTDISELRISRQRLIGGIVIGLLYAFALYGLLYMSREALRLMSITRNNDLWILSDAEVNFYNLVFAFIAVIFGQSACFLFWFERPGKIFGKRLYKRVSVINDQRALNWFFLSAYSKLALSIALIYATFFGYYNFYEKDNLYPEYNYVIVLIIIVLFLQMWTTIRQVFKNKSLKWMLASMLILSVLALGLSKINLIDYKAFNADVLKHNAHYTYKIEFPDVTHYETTYYRKGRRANEIYFALNPNSIEEDSALTMFFEGKEMSFKEISNKIKTRSSQWWHYDELHLHFHRKIKMKQVWKVYEEMGKEAFTKLSFAVVKVHHENDTRYYHNYSFPARIPLQFWDSELLPPVVNLYDGLEKMEDVIEIRQAVSGHFVDDFLLENEMFKSVIAERIRESSPKYVIKFHIKDDADIESYLQSLSLMKETIQVVWDEYALQHFGEKEEWLDIEQRKEIRKKYPQIIFQITEEMEAKYE